MQPSCGCQQVMVETLSAPWQGRCCSSHRHNVYCVKFWVTQRVALPTSYHCLKVSWLVTSGYNSWKTNEAFRKPETEEFREEMQVAEKIQKIDVSYARAIGLYWITSTS